MNKKILSGILLAAIVSITFFSCEKFHKSTTDPTLNYFPIKYGHYVVYNVDSIYYGYNPNNGGHSEFCTKYEIKSQMKYAVTDTFRDAEDRLSYVVDVYSRPYIGGYWTENSVILVTLTPTTVTNLLAPVTYSLLYTQDRTQYVKLMFPIQNGYSWKGNQNAEVNDAFFAYLKNWNYTYQNMGKSYFNGQVEFDNTVTCLEDDESVYYPGIDTGVAGYRTYAKEVYAYNVGMIYKEWTHYTWNAFADSCWSGYRVTMTAVEYNQ